ncbi:MAG: imidazolonepropionase, partial [Verrucomicrobia bacterium]|nr:imidazolonepropionase [Verrucomicrobiota bacterium]
AADPDSLRENGRETLNRMLEYGTTTVEVKSGYGLSLQSELKMLRVISELADTHVVDIVPTFLGAHEFPDEWRDDRDGYVDHLIDDMMPAVAAEKLARFCDVFCERGVFTSDQARRVLGVAMEHGLAPRLHADEFAPSGAAELAGELHAFSADHLMAASEPGLASLRRADTVAILLPGTSLSLRLRDFAPARRMIEMGIPVALATDCNPGSSMTTNLPLIVAIAVLQMGMTLEEAITAVTVNAAASLGLASEIGRIAPGMRADLQILAANTPAAIVYRLGDLTPERVLKDGRWVAGEGHRLP